MFGRQKADSAKEHAKEAYEACANSTEINDTPRALRARLVLRAKANIDLTFIEGARKTEVFEKAKMAALLEGKGTDHLKKPELIEPFKISRSGKGSILSYIPLELAQTVFEIGGSYQKEGITQERAIELTQAIMDQIALSLGINEEIVVLNFLRDSSDDTTEDDKDSE